MAGNKVTFKKGTLAEYNALVKDENTIYWLTDTQEVFVGSKKYGVGLEATTSLSGLMSAEDKANLDQLVQHGVAISGKDNNILEMVEGDGAGLYAALAIEETDDGTYELVQLKSDGSKKTLGSKIDIPKAFKSGSVEIVSE